MEGIGLGARCDGLFDGRVGREQLAPSPRDDHEERVPHNKHQQERKRGSRRKRVMNEVGIDVHLVLFVTRQQRDAVKNESNTHGPNHERHHQLCVHSIDHTPHPTPTIHGGVCADL